MNIAAGLRRLTLAVALAAVGVLATPLDAAQSRAASDDSLRSRVQAALAAASDLPSPAITVAVQQGVVTLSGRLSSDGMRGVTYQNSVLQQSLGAVVRAVPGVKDVRFAVQIESGPPAPPPAGASPARESRPANPR